AQGLLVAVQELDLDLAKPSRDALVVEYGHRVVDDLGAAGTDDLAARSQPCHGHERLLPQERHQQRDQLGRRHRGRACPLQLDADVTRPGQLELPDAGAVLDPMAERDPVSGKRQLRRVVVGGDENPRRPDLAAELRQREPFAGRELDLTLDRLFHHTRVDADPVHHVSDWVNVRSPVVKISLTPRTSEFYELFSRAGVNALVVARLVERRFREHPNSGVTQDEVKAAETAGDSVTRDLIRLLNTQYLPPFDRDDIYMLATEIDDVVDYLEEASDLLGLYGVELPTRHAGEQCRVIVEACERLAAAPDTLNG